MLASVHTSSAASPIVSSGSNIFDPPSALLLALSASLLLPSSRMTVGATGSGTAAAVVAEVSKASLLFGIPTANPTISRSAAVPPIIHPIGRLLSRAGGTEEVANGVMASTLPAASTDPVSTSPEKFSQKDFPTVSVVSPRLILFTSDMMRSAFGGKDN